jgi:hypothetical protein
MSNWFADAIGSLAGDIEYYVGGGAQEQATGDQLDAQLQALNQTEYSAGGRVYNEIQDTQGTAAADQAYQTVQKDEASGATGNVLDELQTAGQEGANQGLSNLWSGIANALKGALGLFPWWLWLLALGALFIYLGGLGWLERKARLKLA